MMLMRRIIFTAILISSGFFQSSSLFAGPEVSAGFENKKFGIQLISNENWTIGHNKETAPENLKTNFPADKDPDTSPLFLGQMVPSPVFVRFLIEKTGLDMEEYFRLFEFTLQNEHLTLKSAKYSAEHKVMEWVYTGTKNGITLIFNDFVTYSDGHIMRMSFWTLSSLSGKYDTASRGLAEKLKIINKESAEIFPFREYQNTLKDLKLNPEFDQGISADIKPDDDGLPGAVFYTVQGKHNKVYILGSIHVGKPDFYPFNKYIENAFAESGNLAVEADIRTMENPDVAKRIRSLTYLEENKTLDTVISPGLYLRVKDVFESHGRHLSDYNRMQPWLVANILTSLTGTSEGFIPAEGVDRHFLELSGSKKIIELEGNEEQIRIFNNLDGESSLEYALISGKKTGALLIKLVKLWKAGNTEELYSAALPSTDNEKIIYSNTQKILIDDRNIVMTEKIDEFLKKDEVYFVIIGAAHLGGKTGIINLLKKKGFNPVQYKG
jgi:uncharacterized protein